MGQSWGGKGTISSKDDKSVAGAFKRLFGGARSAVNAMTGEDVDIDSTVALVDSANRVKETIYYGNRRSNNGAVVHAGDDLTGRNKQGVYDNEEITIDLSKVAPEIQQVIVLSNIYNARSRGQHYGQVDSYIRILKADNREELVRYNLDDDYSGMTAMIGGVFYRHHYEWKFRAVGAGSKDGSISSALNTFLRG
ncbi:Stress response protein SCP2 [compost metagenome]